MSNRLAFPRSHLPAVIGAAYDLSAPRGMGFLHARPGPLSSEELKIVANQPLERCGMNRQGISLDYVLGRAVKLVILHDPADDSFYLVDDDRGWHDHTEAQWESLKATARAAA